LRGKEMFLRFNSGTVFTLSLSLQGEKMVRILFCPFVINSYEVLQLNKELFSGRSLSKNQSIQNYFPTGFT
jgi:hypothetical protein